MSTQPFLMQFSEKRTEALEIPGRYDDHLHVWVVETTDGPRPIINADTSLAELMTKTNTVAERDDPSAAMLVELSTKTSHELERDDVDPRSIFLELVTVTKVGQERPDI